MPEFQIVRAAQARDDSAAPPQPKAFHGWRIVFAGTLILSVSSGIGFYGHGVILDPLRALHGWPKAVISSAVTLYFLTAGVMGMIVGRQIDRYGPKWVLVFGSLAIGAGFVLLSRISTVWQLYGVYFLMAMGFSCTSLVPINTLITNWFIRRRGFAMSLTNTGLSAGGVVLVPLASFMISHWGLKTALPVLGTIYCAVIIPIAVFFVRQRPSDLNQFPDGETPPASTAAGSGRSIKYAAQMQEWTRPQALRTVAFWSIVVAFFLALAGQIAFLVHQISFLSPHLGRAGAAAAVSITAGASIAGRLLLGTFVGPLRQTLCHHGVFSDSGGGRADLGPLQSCCRFVSGNFRIRPDHGIDYHDAVADHRRVFRPSFLCDGFGAGRIVCPVRGRLWTDHRRPYL